MSVSRSFIDDLLQRTDIVALISRYVTLNRSGSGYKGLCPFHDEKTASFHVMPEKQFFHCFGCGVSGDAISFLKQFDNVEFYPALEKLAEIQGVELPRSDGTQAETEEVRDKWQVRVALLQQATHYFCSMLRNHQYAHKAHTYLKQRNIDGITLEQFQIGYAPPERNALCRLWQSNQEHIDIALELGLIKRNDRGEMYDQFRNRIIFPIRDSRGRVRGFGGRAIDADQQPKYLNSTESDLFHKGNLIYGLFESLEKRSQESWLVVEGYIDVVTLHRHGFERVVACLGTAINERQIQWLGRYHNRLSFAFDGDKAGKMAAEKTMHLCLPLVTDERVFYFTFLPNDEDPDTLVNTQGAESLRTLVEHKSMPLSDMFIRWLQQQGQTNSVEGKAKMASVATKALARVPESYFRQLLLNQVEEITDARKQWYRSKFKNPQAPSIRGSRLSNINQSGLLHFLVSVINNRHTLTEGTPPLLEQLQLLAPYAAHVPLDFFQKIADNSDIEMPLIMVEMLEAEQLQKIRTYQEGTHEEPGPEDVHRLFNQVRKYYYDAMTSQQKKDYMHSINQAQERHIENTTEKQVQAE